MCKVNKGIISHNLVQRKCKDGFGTINSVFCQVWYITILFSFFSVKLSVKIQSKKTPKQMAFWYFIEEKQMEVELTV